MKPVSRQRRWQLKMIAGGRCSQCGNLRKHYRDFCDPCEIKHREFNRRRLGCRPHVKGKPGRPPFVRGIRKSGS